MEIKGIVEYNREGFFIQAENFPGAFARGKTEEEALAKLPTDVSRWLRWACVFPLSEGFSTKISERVQTAARISDGDTEIIFESEKNGLTLKEYLKLKNLALKSAADFLALYNSMPDKDGAARPPRKTFYGDVPRTANEMYEHTKNVNSYYFGEIGIGTDNEPDILACRQRGFAQVQQTKNYLANKVVAGSYGEQWSLRKVCRRFIWHDRIHGHAMVRLATALWGQGAIADPYFFQVPYAD